MVIKTQSHAALGLLVPPTVIGNNAVMVQSPGHSGKGTASVEAAVDANDRSQGRLRSPFPDGQVLSIEDWQGGQSVRGSREACNR